METRKAKRIRPSQIRYSRHLTARLAHLIRIKAPAPELNAHMRLIEKFLKQKR